MEYLYQCYDTELGILTLVSSGDAIVTVHFGEGHPQGCFQEEDEILMEAIFQINQYLAGQRKTFAIPLDPMGNEEEKRIYAYVKEHAIYGSYLTYEGIAEALKMEVQDVEEALETNSCPLLVPCHRVIRANKKIGVYVTDVKVKSALLSLEHRFK